MKITTQNISSIFDPGKSRILLKTILVVFFGVCSLTVFDWKTNAHNGNNLFSQIQKLTANDGDEGDWYGLSVAVSGDTAVVGAYYAQVGSNIGQGAAYVYIRENNQWVFQQKLTANDGAFNDIFGFNVAIAGDRIIVGSPGDDNQSNGFNHGSAYIFERTGAVWTQKQKLLPDDPGSEKEFGHKVAVFDNTVFIGAKNDNNYRGAAYVFELGQNTWTQKQKLTVSGGEPYDAFGASLAVNGNTAIVGSPNAGDSDRGKVFVYTKVNNVWIFQQMLEADDGLEDDFFGTDVDILGDRIVISASGDDIGEVSNQGSAYIFEKEGKSWIQRQKIIVPEIEVYENFGHSVSISEDYIAIGANYAKIGENEQQGAAYIFKRIGSSWVQKEKIIAEDGSAFDNFGVDVEISDGNVISGAFTDVVEGNVNQGSAYVFKIQSSTPFDFDGDGKTDISIFRPTGGEWWYQRSSDNSIPALQFGAGTDRIVPADYTGDGKTDIAVWRESTGEWFVLRSEDNSYYAFPFGSPGDIPIPADYDGDGQADAAVFRPSSGTWYISKSSGGVSVEPFGLNGDVPVSADYDGDGKADIAIFRPSSGVWWINRSGAGLFAAAFGSATDKPVQGDYTGDGKADIAFWRPSTGEWFVLRSENASYYAAQFGSTGDIPTAGDYDGDGKIDTAVFRPSSAVWYVNRSTAGLLIQQFGFSTDQPVPSAFVP